MAKFKVGDRVKTRMPNGGWSDTVVIERIIESAGKKLYVCRTSNGTYPAHEWDIRLANSRAAKNDADPYLSEKLKLMIRQGAVSEAAGGKPMPGDVVFEYRGKRYYTDKDSAHMVKQFSDAGLVKMHNSCGVRSTIPAVNAALGANAVKPGDMVKVEWEYDADKKGIVGMTGEVLKISSGIATVAIREKGNREYIVAGHALRKIANAARNAFLHGKPIAVGDKVAWIDRYYGSMHGTVLSVGDRTSRVQWTGIPGMFGKPKPGEGVFVVPTDELVAENACARNAKWVILYRDGGKEKIVASSHSEAKKVADKKSAQSGRGYRTVIVDDGEDYETLY